MRLQTLPALFSLAKLSGFLERSSLVVVWSILPTARTRQVSSPTTRRHVKRTEIERERGREKERVGGERERERGREREREREYTLFR